MIFLAALLVAATLLYLVRLAVREGPAAALRPAFETIAPALGAAAFILAVQSVTASAANAEPLPPWLPPAKRTVQLILLVGNVAWSGMIILRRRQWFHDGLDVVGFLCGSMGLPQVVIEIGYDP